MKRMILMYVLMIIIGIVLILTPIIRVYLNGTEEDIERMWSVELAGSVFKIIATGIFVLVSSFNTIDFIEVMDKFEDNTNAWKVDYGEYDSYYYDHEELDKEEFEERRFKEIRQYIYDELKLLGFCALIHGIGSLIKRHAEDEYERKKLIEQKIKKENGNTSLRNYGYIVKSNEKANENLPAYCGGCGGKLSENSVFCPSCGKQILETAPKEQTPVIRVPVSKTKIDMNNEWVCSKCGAKSPQTAIMCKMCGQYK